MTKLAVATMAMILTMAMMTTLAMMTTITMTTITMTTITMTTMTKTTSMADVVHMRYLSMGSAHILVESYVLLKLKYLECAQARAHQ
jgi:hypothetical protein